MRRLEGSSHHYWKDLVWNLLDLVVHLEKGGLMTGIVVALLAVAAASAAAVGLLG